MTSLLKAAGVAEILAVGFATVTAELKAAQLNTTVREGEGATTELSANASAITYWVNEADGWHVVTTVDVLIEPNDDSDEHAIVRFSSVLLPGQSQTISVPSPIGERQQALRIRRLGDQLEMSGPWLRVTAISWVRGETPGPSWWHCLRRLIGRRHSVLRSGAQPHAVSGSNA